MKKSTLKSVNVVLGATSGLGWHLASQFFKKGQVVMAFSRRLDRLQGLKAMLCEKMEDNKRLQIADGNILDAKSLEHLFAHCMEINATIDRVFVCAGTYVSVESTDNVGLWRSIMDTNFFGMVNVACALAKVIQNVEMNNKISLVAITSSLSKRHVQGSAAYSCSKRALEAYVETIEHKKLLAYAVQMPPFRSEMNPNALTTAKAVANKLILMLSKESNCWHGKVLELK